MNGGRENRRPHATSRPIEHKKRLPEPTLVIKCRNRIETSPPANLAENPGDGKRITDNASIDREKPHARVMLFQINPAASQQDAKRIVMSRIGVAASGQAMGEMLRCWTKWKRSFELATRRSFAGFTFSTHDGIPFC
jgi:hypothetical protein